MANQDLVNVREGGLRALTPQKEEAIVAAVGRGVPLATAARTVGIGERTLRSWLRVAAEDRTTWEDGVPISAGARADVQRFAGRVEVAMAECEATLAQAITRAVGVVGKSGVPEWRPAMEFLKHSPTTRERWHEYRQVEVIHTDPFPELEQVKAMSDDELMAEYERLSLPPGV
jgi:transposase-like protein